MVPGAAPAWDGGSRVHPLPARRPARDRGWTVYVVLLLAALGSEFVDENPFEAIPFVPWPRFIAVFGLTCFLAYLSLLRREPREPAPGVKRPVLYFWYFTQLSLLGVLWMGPTADKLLKFFLSDVHFTVYVVFVYALLRLLSWERLWVLVRSYYALGLVAAAVGMVQFVHARTGWFAALPSKLLAIDETYSVVGVRVSALFGEPSYAARYFVHWIALSLAFYTITEKRRYLYGAGLFVFAFYTAASLAGAVVFLAFCGILALVMLRGRRFRVPRPLKLGALAAGTAAAAYGMLAVVFSWSVPVPDLIGGTLDRLELVRMGLGGSHVRFDSVVAGLKVWLLSPAFGVGLGNLRLYVGQFYTEPDTFLRSYMGTDSAYSTILGELGVVGLAAFLYMVFRIVRGPFAGRAGTLTIHRDHPARTLLAFLQIDFAAQAVGMINYADILSPHLWFVIALILGLQESIARREAGRRAPVPDAPALPPPAAAARA